MLTVIVSFTSCKKEQWTPIQEETILASDLDALSSDFDGEWRMVAFETSTSGGQAISTSGMEQIIMTLSENSLTIDGIALEDFVWVDSNTATSTLDTSMHFTLGNDGATLSLFRMSEEGFFHHSKWVLQ